MTRPAKAAEAWAIAGVGFLFGNAVLRLGARGVDAMAQGLRPAEWLGFAAITALFVWGEGYRALQLRYSPFVIDRIERLRAEHTAWKRLLAPLYALALVGGPARAVLRAWAGAAAIVLAVVIVSRLPHPWRGIVDFAVAAALAWGLAAIVHAWWQRRAGARTP